MALLNRITTTDRGRVSELQLGQGNNQQARASDVNPIIDKVNVLSPADGVMSSFAVVPQTSAAIDVTATATGAQVATGYITSTSAAAVGITLPTATALGLALGASAGTRFIFTVDNTAGANTVTVVVNTGITAATPVITGGATLTVSVANAIGVFMVVFSSATVAKLYRIG